MEILVRGGGTADVVAGAGTSDSRLVPPLGKRKLPSHRTIRTPAAVGGIQCEQCCPQLDSPRDAVGCRFLPKRCGQYGRDVGGDGTGCNACRYGQGDAGDVYAQAAGQGAGGCATDPVGRRPLGGGARTGPGLAARGRGPNRCGLLPARQSRDAALFRHPAARRAGASAGQHRLGVAQQPRASADDARQRGSPAK